MIIYINIMINASEHSSEIVIIGLYPCERYIFAHFEYTVKFISNNQKLNT